MSSTPDIIKTKVLSVLAAGGSLRDAADFAGITRRRLTRWRKHDSAFAKDIRRAIANGKFRHLVRIGTDDTWRSSAFFIERRWPDQFAKTPRRPAIHKGDKIVRMRPVPDPRAPPPA